MGIQTSVPKTTYTKRYGDFKKMIENLDRLLSKLEKMMILENQIAEKKKKERGTQICKNESTLSERGESL